jgi:hypothetical protein
LAFACEKSNFLTEKEYIRLLEKQNTRLVRTYRGDSTTVYVIYEDHGMAQRSYYLLKRDSGNKYYFTNKSAGYTNGLIWGGKIYQTSGVSVGPSQRGKFIEIDFYGEDNLSRKYTYDTTNIRGYNVQDITEEGGLFSRFR